VGQLSLSIWNGTNQTKQNQFDGDKKAENLYVTVADLQSMISPLK
jgi:hypothetical protein